MVKITFNIDGQKKEVQASIHDTLKDVIDNNYETIFSRNPIAIREDVYSWESFSFELIEKLKEKYFFQLYDENSNKISLLYTIRENLFYYIECMGMLDSPDSIKTKNIRAISVEVERVLKEIGIHEERILAHKKYLEIENVLFEDLKNNFDIIFNLFFSSEVLEQCINAEHFEYYKEFLIQLIYKICMLKFCEATIAELKGSSSDFTYKKWVYNFLYSIEFNAMTLLNIPEITLREKGSSNKIYNLLLYSNGFGKYDKNNPTAYYSNSELYNFIKGVSVYWAYKDNFFDNLNIDNYIKYLRFCKKTDKKDKSFSAIVHLFRVIYNSLKHSQNISINFHGNFDQNIKHNLGLRIIDHIDHDDTFNVDQDDTFNDYQKLKEYIIYLYQEKYPHDKIIFDKDLKESYGIWIKIKNKGGFTITLFDLEFMIKILFGILEAIYR